MALHTKAQITVFIILALVLLLSIGTYLYFTTTVEERRAEEQRPTLQKAPTEFAPLIDYVNDCVHTTAKQALKRVGEGGGYIDSSKIRHNPFEPTEGEGIELSPQSELVIPYWWHLKGNNECQDRCVFESKRVPIEHAAGTLSIEGQIDDYVEENIKTCLADFTVFKNQGYKVTAREPRAVTTVAEQDVFITLTYPLTIIKNGIEHKTDTFYSSLPVNFREIYNVATELTNLQAENNYLEKDIRNLIDAFSRVDKKALPPVSDLRFGLGIGTVWVKFDVEQKIKALLTNYASLLQIVGTRSYGRIPAPDTVPDKELYDALYNTAKVVPLEKDHPSLAARFTYLDWWKPYVDISGCRGQICQPESVGTTLAFIFGIQRYNFAYDISLPVLVEISSPTAFNNEGYTFHFALEANLRNNHPMPTDFKPLKLVSETTAPSMLCDNDKRTGGFLNLTLLDGKTNKGVHDALITYSCGATSCSLGTTIKGKFEVALPNCLGGVLSAEKYEYHPAAQPLDTFRGEEQKISMTLEPYRLIDFSVTKYLLKKGITWELDLNNPTPQAPDEQTLITMERAGQTFEEPFTVFGDVYGGPLSTKFDYSKDIRIIPGMYKVRLYTIKYPEPPIVIPSERRCFRSGIGEDKTCRNIPEEDLVFHAMKKMPNGKFEEKPLPLGGADFSFNLTKEELDNAKEIGWKVLNFAIDKVLERDRKIEDLDELGKLREYSLAVQEQLKPALVPK